MTFTRRDRDVNDNAPPGEYCRKKFLPRTRHIGISTRGINNVSCAPPPACRGASHAFESKPGSAACSAPGGCCGGGRFNVTPEVPAAFELAVGRMNARPPMALVTTLFTRCVGVSPPCVTRLSGGFCTRASPNPAVGPPGVNFLQLAELVDLLVKGTTVPGTTVQYQHYCASLSRAVWLHL